MGTRRKLLESLIPTNFLPRLPDAYQEVEYIQSVLTQSIDTLFNATGNTRIVLTISNLFFSRDCYIFGRWDSSTTPNGFGLYIYSGGSKLLFLYGSTQMTLSTTVLQNTDKHTIDFSNKAIIDGTQVYSFSKQTFTAVKTIHLFTTEIVGGSSSSYKLYSCKLYNNDILVRDFIPCYRKADGVAGLYDIVNGVFYTNAGTGTFICGRPVVSRVYQPVEYLESTGTQYIDTGLVSSEGTWIQDADIQFTTIDIPDQLNGSARGLFWGVTSNPGNLQFCNSIQEAMSPNAIADTQRHRFISIIDSASALNPLYIDGVKYTSNRGIPYVYGEKFVLCDLIYSASEEHYYCSQKIYSYKIFKNKILLRDFVPCYRIADGVAGLLDKVHGVFYTNKGTGEFKCGKPLIDPRYQAVEYIESTGKQYIDTGVVLKAASIGVEVKTRFIQTSYSVNSYAIGDEEVNGYRGINVWVANSIIRLSIGNVTSYYTTAMVPGNVNTYKILLDSTNVYSYVDGTLVNTLNNFDYSSLSESTTKVFYIGRTGQFNNGTKRIYYAKLWKQNTLVRSFVPCYRKSDGEIGLYDIVEGKFYTNSGTGTFLKGQNI